jgi:hypothetical protein
VAGIGLAATVYWTDASPCPLALVIATQLALVVADHAQSRVVVTASVPCPPSDVKLVVAEPTWTWHFAEVGAATVFDTCEEVHPMTAPAREQATMNPNT